jgi:predicted TIM-barrel fold metal-dependent hydrolase
MSPVSNGEWIPRPITEKQRASEKVVAEEAERIAKRHGLSRAQFLRTAAGTLLGFSVLNRIHGLDAWGDNAVLPVRKVECEDLDAARERLDTKPYFIFDVQTHHVDPEEFGGPLWTGIGCGLRFRNDQGDLPCDDLSVVDRSSYIKEMFLDSETHMAVISGLPSGVPLGPEAMALTRDTVNELAGSQRCLAQAIIDPAPPTIPAINFRTGLDSLDYQIQELKGAAIKCYSYNGNWRLDDELIAYPLYERALQLGIGLINCHKGLPASFAPGSEQSVRTIDIPKAVADWPKLKFCAYHSGYFESAAVHPEGKGGSSEFIEQLEGMPKKHRKRVFAEIGSTFAITVLSDLGDPGPTRAAHFIGQLLKTLGSKNILWGTDSIWWGSPQWLIDAFKVLQIPASLQEEFGYPALRDKDRKRIFGRNAAKLYRIKKKQQKQLCTIPPDTFTELQAARGGIRDRRTLAYFGARTRREFLQRFGPLGA